MGNLSCCLWWLVFGLLLGFLAFWLFDRVFRRSGAGTLASAQASLAQLRDENDALRAQIAAQAPAKVTTPAAAVAAPVATAIDPSVVAQLRSDNDALKAKLAALTAATIDPAVIAKLRSDNDMLAAKLAAAQTAAQTAGQTAAQTAGQTAGQTAAQATPPAPPRPAVATPIAAAAAIDQSQLATLRSDNDALRSQLAGVQAQLAQFQSIAAAAQYGFSPKNRAGEDDLAIVEGIGPKIADLLRNQGIRTFSALAATPVERLVQILADAGPRFKIANHPDTWPRQAQLCAEGKWEELRNYQDVLVDGVDRRKPPEAPKA